MKKIGIDVDNVISDSFPLLLSEANKQFNKNCSYDEIHSYDFHKIMGISREDMVAFIRKVFSEKLPMKCEPVAGAKEAINQIKNDYEIHIVSARPKGYEEDTIEWLNQNEIQFNHLELVSEGQKHIYALDKNIKFFVDDDWKEAYNLAKSGINTFLFDRPWNRDFEKNGFVRIKDWDEILKILQLRR